MGGERPAAFHVPCTPAAGCGEYEALRVGLICVCMCMCIWDSIWGFLFCFLLFKGVFHRGGFLGSAFHDSIAMGVFLFSFFAIRVVQGNILYSALSFFLSFCLYWGNIRVCKYYLRPVVYLHIGFDSGTYRLPFPVLIPAAVRVCLCACVPACVGWVYNHTVRSSNEWSDQSPSPFRDIPHIYSPPPTNQPQHLALPDAIHPY